MLPAAHKILIADDSLEAREALAGLLGSEDREIHFATTGLECLAQAAEIHPDLILLDIMMPELDGLEVCRRLRADPALALTPIIMITALDSRSIRRQGLEAGADDFVSKPLEPLELTLRVRTILRLNRYRRLIEEQAKVRQLEAHYQNLVKYANDIILLADESARLVAANDRALESYGYSSDEILRLNLDDLVAPEHVILHQRGMAILREQGALRLEALHRRRDGSTFPVEISARIIGFEGKRYCQAILRDITERVRADKRRQEAEKALHESAQRYRSLFEDSPIAIWEEDFSAIQPQFHALRSAGVTDFRKYFDHHPEAILQLAAAVKILDVNQASLRLFGAADKSDIRRYIPLFFTEASWPVFKEQMTALAEGQTRFEGEIPIQNPNGQSQVLSLHLVVVPEHEATLNRVLVSFIDITAGRQAEDERRRLLDSLETSVADRTRELSTLYQAARLAAAMQDPPASLREVLRLTLEAVGSPAGALYLWEDEDKDPLSPQNSRTANGARLRLTAHLGLSPDLDAGLEVVPAGSGPVGWVAEHGETLFIHDLATDPRALQFTTLQNYRFFAGLPVRQTSATLGVLCVLGSTDQALSLESLTLLGTLADQIGGMVERARLQQQAEAAAVLQERQRLARDLHDSVTQSLYSFALLADAACKDYRRGDLARLEGTLANVSVSAHQALKEMRLLLYEMRPPTFAPGSLAARLRQRLESVEQHARMNVELSVEGDASSLTLSWEMELYRLAEEALNNALKHARASAVQVHLAVTETGVLLEVTDNGIGFVLPTAVSSGHGLTSLRERTSRLGGELKIISAPGSGTKVRAEFRRSEKAP